MFSLIAESTGLSLSRGLPSDRIGNHVEFCTKNRENGLRSNLVGEDMSRKRSNRRGPSEARRTDNQLVPPSPVPPRQPTAAEQEAIDARGLPLTDVEVRNRAAALKRALGEG